MSDIKQSAMDCVAVGLSALPAVRRGDNKRPSVAAWKMYQSRLPTQDELGEWFTGDESMCLVCGAVSGNLEMIDFDLAGAAYDDWCEVVEDMSPGLLDRLVTETTPSGGKHVVYRCESVVSGNLKLATRFFPADGPGKVTIGDREYAARKNADGEWAASVTMIETRGEGGLFLCAPSPGYELTQGELTNVPTITKDDREVLLGAAWVLDESPRAVVGAGSSGTHDESDRPGDDFNRRGDVAEILERHEWRRVRSGENEHWCRPGKSTGTSATLKGGVFYVFTSNAPPFEAEKGYAPFAVHAMLDHGGDFAAAAKALGENGYGTPPKKTSGVDLSAFRMLSDGEKTSGGMRHDPVAVADLVQSHPELRKPIIHGLLREGETMNIIAAPKTGKSWLSTDLALSIGTGRDWLGAFKTVPGDVLIIDNELHRETSANRVPKVAQARSLEMREIGHRVYIDNLRGRLQDIFTLASYFESIEPNQYKIIVLDAFYRFMPSGGDENDNGTMANIYNCIDSIADRLGCAFVLIHHSSKGNQGGKSVTDVGAGAGAQSRAADTHLVLRPHEEDGVVVLDAAVRSWAPIEPVCLRWNFPVWDVDYSLDPGELKAEKRGRAGKKEPAQTAKDRPSKSPKWTPERLVDVFFGDDSGVPAGEVVPIKSIKNRASLMDDLSGRLAQTLTELAADDGVLEEVEMTGKGSPKGYRLAVKNDDR